MESRDTGRGHSWSIRIMALVALVFDLYLVVHFRNRTSDQTVLNLLLWGGFWLVIVPYWRFAIAEEKLCQLESGLAELEDSRTPELLRATRSIKAQITTLVVIIMALAPCLQWAILRLHFH